MAKTLDLSLPVRTLVNEYPQLKDVMAQLGFPDITNPVALNTVGRVVTIPKGCLMRGLDLDDVVAKLEAAGFAVVNGDGAGDAEQAEPTAAQDEKDSAEVQSPAGDVAAKSGNDGAGNAEQAEPATAQAEKGAAYAQAATASAPEPEAQAPAGDAAEPDDPALRVGQIKALLGRLSAGEDLEAVRQDFVRDFAQVDASEIMDAEQQLIAEGTPLAEVTRLCDVHSALFHGATREEIDGGNAMTMVERMEAAVAAAAAAGKFDTAGSAPAGGAGTAGAKASADAAAAAETGAAASAAPTAQAAPAGTAPAIPATPGLHGMAAAVDEDAVTALLAQPAHPLSILAAENSAILAQAARVREALDQGDRDRAQTELQGLRQTSVHYTKKGDLLYPLLATCYGITGPSNVMWTVDDQIRDELRSLAGDSSTRDWEERVRAVTQRVDEMVYKETNILFPLCVQSLTPRQWRQLAFDMGDYGFCLIEPVPLWDEAEPAPVPEPASPDAVGLSCGWATPVELDALLRTLPGEVTFVGPDDRNQLFDAEYPKQFKRPRMALGRDVWSCHPPQVEPMTRGLIEGFKAGKNDSFEVWASRNGRDMLVRYLAVRDGDGEYLGTLEWVQDMDFARRHYQQLFSPEPGPGMHDLEEREDQEW